MKRLQAMRYVTPLREGGSLPAVVEASDGELYVVKFHGAGQGPRALIAELFVGELARAWGFDVPELAVIELDEVFGRNEPDPEIRDLLRASAGENLGLAYLPGAISYDPIAPPDLDPLLASRVVWLDALTLNIDRTPRNPNLLLHGDKLWLIDHGAALYFHHAGGFSTHLDDPLLPFARTHVLSGRATRLDEAARTMPDAVTAAQASEVLAAIPGAWLAPAGASSAAAGTRDAYLAWLLARLERVRAAWPQELAHA